MILDLQAFSWPPFFESRRYGLRAFFSILVMQMNAYRSILKVVLFCFTISLIWCGDADCLSGSGEDNCASIVCSLLVKHDDVSAKDVQQDAPNCTCVCHLPSIPLASEAFAITLTGERTSDQIRQFTLETPSATPFRPPLAS